MRLWLALFLSISWPSMANAQSSETSPLSLNHVTEWGFTSGGAMDLPGGAHGGEFWAAHLRWGKVLTAPHGPGLLRGRLEYAFEIIPLMVIRETRRGAKRTAQEASVVAGGINPFFWQFNFTSHPHFVPYINLGAGVLLSNGKFPAGSSSFNFTPQGGVGAYWFANQDRALNFGLRFHHISSAGIAAPNPGHNALYFYGGLSWWR
jgi:hypothetical protein